MTAKSKKVLAVLESYLLTNKEYMGDDEIKDLENLIQFQKDLIKILEI